MPVVVEQSDVEAIAPELVGQLTEAQWAFVLASVGLQVHSGAFPSQLSAELAATYLAAHQATLAKARTSGGGALKSVSVGGVSKTYVTDAASQSLTSTGYGREFLRLCGVWCARVVVT